MWETKQKKINIKIWYILQKYHNHFYDCLLRMASPKPNVNTHISILVSDFRFRSPFSLNIPWLYFIIMLTICLRHHSLTQTQSIRTESGHVYVDCFLFWFLIFHFYFSECKKCFGLSMIYLFCFNFCCRWV